MLLPVGDCFLLVLLFAVAVWCLWFVAVVGVCYLLFVVSCYCSIQVSESGLQESCLRNNSEAWSCERDR